MGYRWKILKKSWSMNSHRVVCFGEVLWDIFSSGAEPGGAPMNVAYHLHKQGLNPALITRIGIDAEGRELIDLWSSKGICTDYFQLDYSYPTGKVYARPNAFHEVSYEIVQPVAWDFIAREEGLVSLVSAAEVFVFGSVAARNAGSYDTLCFLLESARKRVFDLNLRAPFYNRAVVEGLLAKADLVKMNLSELELITGWFSDYSTVADRMKAISDRFGLAEMVVTLGADGAFLFREGELFFHPGFKVVVVDTVGSGDAFLAGLLARMLSGGGSFEALEYASALGAFVATCRGACPSYSLEDIIAIQ